MRSFTGMQSFYFSIPWIWIGSRQAKSSRFVGTTKDSTGQSKTSWGRARLAAYRRNNLWSHLQEGTMSGKRFWIAVLYAW